MTIKERGLMKKERFDSRFSMVMYFLKGSIGYFVLFILFACLVSLLDLINPKIISYTVDTVLGDDPGTLPLLIENMLVPLGGTAWLKENLWAVASAVMAVALAGAVCRYFFQYLNGVGSEKLVHNMRNRLFDHILHLPFSWHSENHTGDIIQRCTSDVETIKMFLSEQLTQLFRVIVLIGMALYFMFNMNVRLTLVVVAFIPVIVGYSLYFHTKIGDQFEKVDVEEGKLSAIAQENLTGVRVVRAFGAEAYERARFEKQNSYYTDFWVRLMKLMSAFWTSSDLVSYLQLLAVMVYGTVLCVEGEISVGTFIAFNSYTAMLMWPIRSLGRTIANMSKAGISIDRLRYIMNAETEEDHGVCADVNMHGDIVFDHVSYQYENGSKDILQDVSFTIPGGKTIGILGGTGSGKSTLMYLLDRLYELPQSSGTITIDGTDIRDIPLFYLRENIGMVLQEPYLFSRTLEENIAIANRSAGHEDVLKASRTASLDHAVSHFKEGYQTFVGERGVTLSGGQKQRTAIAQMLVRKAPVMIFDDSLSAVDAETDAKIRNALKKSTGDSTVILIAHRITTLMNADVIVVLEDGKVAEIGNHAQLMENHGIYRQIYDLQSRNMETEVIA